MKEPITLQDPHDPRLRDYTGLTDMELRRHREPAEGLFVAEGEKVIRRARQAGYGMRSMLLSAKWLEAMRDVVEETPAPVYVVRPEVAEQVTGYHVHRGALASMRRAPLPAPETVLEKARRVVVLESVNDHTNLGAVFRSAAALGMDAVLLSPDCADPLYRRSVKVSMGAVFAVPYARPTNWQHGLGALSTAGFRLLALTPDEQAAPIEDAVTRFREAAGPDRLALLLGAEGSGLSARALRVADERVRIEMASGVDSLNVAAAAAVACYVVAGAGGSGRSG